MTNIISIFTKANTALGDGAADSAGGALLEQAHNFLTIIAGQQAVNCNAMLDTFKFDVELLEGVVTDIFNNPQYYSLGRKVIKPSETVKGDYYFYRGQSLCGRISQAFITEPPPMFWLVVLPPVILPVL